MKKHKKIANGIGDHEHERMPQMSFLDTELGKRRSIMRVVAKELQRLALQRAELGPESRYLLAGARALLTIASGNSFQEEQWTFDACDDALRARKASTRNKPRRR